jgi:hypothetical protein
MTETVKVEAVAVSQTERVIAPDSRTAETVTVSETERVVTTINNNGVIVTGGLLPRTFQATIGGAVNEIDTTNLEDGSMLVYEQNIEKWKAVRKLEKQIMEGGFF